MNYEKVRRKLDLKAIYGLMLSKMGLYPCPRYFVNSYCPSKFRHFMIKIPKKMIDFHLPACDIIETTILIP